MKLIMKLREQDLLQKSMIENVFKLRRESKMKLKINNNELVAILDAIELSLDYRNNDFILASLKSFVKKVNNNVSIYNRNPEEKAIDLLDLIREIEEED